MQVRISETIKKHRERLGLSQAQLADALSPYGLKVLKTTINNWERENARPNIVQLFALCDVLGIDDLWWEFCGLHKGAYAGFNEQGRQKIREFSELVFQIEKYRDEEPQGDERESRLIRLYDIGVSAGTGNFLDESDYKMIEAPPYVPASADFALRISGDSMEPLYQDRQIIWIKEQRTLSDGEIGIFFYDGGSYCKKLIVTRDGALLRSLNKAYDDIPINEENTFHVIGKVVS